MHLCHRLELQILPDGRTAVQLAVSASTKVMDRLSLSTVEGLRSNGMRRKSKTDAELLWLCHERLHGTSCHADGCGGAFGRQDKKKLRNFTHLRQSAAVKAVMARGPASALRQQHTFILFDFIKGSFKVQEAELPAQAVTQSLQGAGSQRLARGVTHVMPAVGMHLCLQGVIVRVQLRVACRVKLDFTSPPPRASAAAAAATRARLEQDLEQELAAAEAEENDRVLSWQLAQQLAASEEEKARLAQEKVEMEERAQAAAEEREAAAEEREAAERSTAERLNPPGR